MFALITFECHLVSRRGAVVTRDAEEGDVGSYCEGNGLWPRRFDPVQGLRQLVTRPNPESPLEAIIAYNL